MLAFIANILGIVGVVMITLAYILLETGYLHAHDYIFPSSNLCGSLLIILSLMFEWNLPAFLMEAAWACVSLFGIFQAFKVHKKLQRQN